MRNRWRVIILIIALVLCQTQAFAWGDTGHMVISQISDSKLSPAAKASIEQLAPLLNTEIKSYDRRKLYDSLTIGNYLDDLRNDPSKNFMPSWHFIQKPFFDSINAVEVPQSEENVVTRIRACIQALKANPGTTREQAELLAQLIHFVGDVHQPLHCAVRFTKEYPYGDRGGNLFLINAPKKSLHAYWDTGGGLFNFEEFPRPLTKVALASIEDFARDAMSAYPDTNSEWKEMDANQWADESFKLAVSFAYPKIRQNSQPTLQYQRDTQAISRRRLAMAGYRLAALLNEIYTETNKPDFRRPRRRSRAE